MSISPVSFSNVSSVSGLNECCEPKKVMGTRNLEQPQKDTVQFTGRSASMSDDEKKELILKARITAAGWSVFGGVFSTLYYALRSEQTVAKKYDLDVVEDKELVHKIKKEQTMHSLPGVLDLGLFAWIYNKFVVKPEDVDL